MAKKRSEKGFSRELFNKNARIRCRKFGSSDIYRKILTRTLKLFLNFATNAEIGHFLILKSDFTSLNTIREQWLERKRQRLSPGGKCFLQSGDHCRGRDACE